MKALIGLMLGMVLGAGTTLQVVDKPVETISIELEIPAPEPKELLYENEIECVAKTVYGEARGESEFGQVLVAFSIVSRTLDPRWPDNACEVVRQKGQYAGYWAAKVTKDKKSYEKSLEVARLVSLEYPYSPEILREILYFTSSKEVSKFHRSKEKVMTVNNHTFFRDYNDRDKQSNSAAWEG